jgi:hypothetical protein
LFSVDQSIRVSGVPGMNSQVPTNLKSEAKKPRITKSMLGCPNITYPCEKSKPKRLF